MEGYTKIGRIRPNYTGAWNAETAYTVLEMVKNEAGTASYIAKQDVPAGTPLTDEAYWAMVLDAGDVIAAAEQAAADANKAAQEYAELDGRVDQLSEEIVDVNKDLDENYVCAYSENLIDVNTRYKDNTNINAAGVFEELDKAYVWKIETFKRDVTYYFSCVTDFGMNNSHVWFMRRDGSLVSSNVIGKKGNFVVTDSDIKAIMLQDQCYYSDFFTNPDRAAIYLSEKDEYNRYAKDKVSQNIGFSEKQQSVIDDLYERTKSPLWGKKLVVNGDSICEGTVNGGGYAKIIGDMYNMTVQNIGISGGTITADTYMSNGTTPRHWVCRTIENMDSDADYVLLEGGVNDASVGVNLGEITQKNRYNRALDDTTFYGAFESMLKQATLRFAGKKIAYIAVHKMTDGFNSTGDESTNLYHAAKKCCEKWGVPFIDLNVSVPPLAYFGEDSGLKSLCDSYTKPDANGKGDGWHPNVLGYETYYVPKIVSFLESM